jgi:Lon-like ATP-dependent protease
LKIVQELGEATFPEPTVKVVSADDTSSPSPSAEETLSNESEKSSTVPNSHESAFEDPSSEQQKAVKVTTAERQPMNIPDTVHIHVTADNLKEYVGPPIYQKDRMYAKPPPPGVSTGLGYLGNGSGAVMPIEAMVGL